MASLVHPRRFQTEGELNTVRRLLGWSAQETGWGVRAGSVPLGNLRAGEFVLFTSHVSAGVGLPISSFLLLLLEDFGLQLQHLTPHSPLPGAPNVVVLQTTAGWRKAPALAQRVCTQGVASLRSISLQNTRNTAGFRVVRAAGA